MNIESRKSIHREDRTTKPNAEKMTADRREPRKIYSDAYKRSPILGERGEIESVADKSAAIHGSQENLYEEILHETEHSYSASFKNTTPNNNVESLKSSARLRKNKQDTSRVRTESANQSKLKPSSPQQKTEQVPGYKCSAFFVIALICLGLVYLLIHFVSSDDPGQHCSFNDLNNKYPGQPTLWKCLESGIDDVLNKRIDKPSVTLLVHKGSKRANELIRDIANTASNCIDSSMEPVVFRNSDFTSDDAANDYGVIIDKYKKTAKEGNVVMIADLNEIPAEAARALHAICDRDSPIFRKVVILLSLTAEYNGGRPIDIAVNALNNLWEGKIMANELGPLLTRVTDEVVLLQS